MSWRMGKDIAAAVGAAADVDGVGVVDEGSADDEAHASNTHAHAATAHELEG
jgi:hypothetical protein